jgi:hypothetical protein
MTRSLLGSAKALYLLEPNLCTAAAMNLIWPPMPLATCLVDMSTVRTMISWSVEPFLVPHPRLQTTILFSASTFASQQVLRSFIHLPILSSPSTASKIFVAVGTPRIDHWPSVVVQHRPVHIAESSAYGTSTRFVVGEKDQFSTAYRPHLSQIRAQSRRVMGQLYHSVVYIGGV